MRAMLLRQPKTPLQAVDLDVPKAGPNEIAIAVECCAVCRTDLHVVDGELPDPRLPLIPGHQIVGHRVDTWERVGVPWLGWTCGTCGYCKGGRENLCDRAKFTGYTLDGGYAAFVNVDERYCFPIPDEYAPDEAAPLLCAGLIGYRAYRMAGDARRLGLYGFGSSAQILAQVAKADGREVYAFVREGDTAALDLALRMGATWAGSSREAVELDAAIIFAPAGELVPAALSHVVKGGTVVCAGIHMTDIPSFPYSILWGERVVRSVANLTRQDGLDFFARLKTLRIETQRRLYPLEQANEALDSLRRGTLTGTAVLEVAS